MDNLDVPSFALPASPTSTTSSSSETNLTGQAGERTVKQNSGKNWNDVLKELLPNPCLLERTQERISLSLVGSPVEQNNASPEDMASYVQYLPVGSPKARSIIEDLIKSQRWTLALGCIKSMHGRTEGSVTKEALLAWRSGLANLLIEAMAKNPPTSFGQSFLTPEEEQFCKVLDQALSLIDEVENDVNKDDLNVWITIMDALGKTHGHLLFDLALGRGNYTCYGRSQTCYYRHCEAWLEKISPRLMATLPNEPKYLSHKIEIAQELATEANAKDLYHSLVKQIMEAKAFDQHNLPSIIGGITDAGLRNELCGYAIQETDDPTLITDMLFTLKLPQVAGVDGMEDDPTLLLKLADELWEGFETEEKSNFLYAFFKRMKVVIDDRNKAVNHHTTALSADDHIFNTYKPLFLKYFEAYVLIALSEAESINAYVVRLHKQLSMCEEFKALTNDYHFTNKMVMSLIEKSDWRAAISWFIHWASAENARTFFLMGGGCFSVEQPSLSLAPTAEKVLEYGVQMLPRNLKSVDFFQKSIREKKTQEAWIQIINLMFEKPDMSPELHQKIAHELKKEPNLSTQGVIWNHYASRVLKEKAPDSSEEDMDFSVEEDVFAGYHVK